MAHEFDEGDETTRLDAYVAANGATIALIVRDLTDRGVPEGALDDLVTDAVENLGDDASDWGSKVNNGGLERQVAFVLQENGSAEGTALIRSAAAQALVPPTP